MCCSFISVDSRIFEILPQRIQTWHQSPCKAEMKNKADLEKVRQQQLQARQRLVELDSKLQDLTALIERAKHSSISTNEDVTHLFFLQLFFIVII